MEVDAGTTQPTDAEVRRLLLAAKDGHRPHGQTRYTAVQIDVASPQELPDALLALNGQRLTLAHLLDAAVDGTVDDLELLRVTVGGRPVCVLRLER